MARKVPDVIAAVDLGSNSFHMVVARYSHGQLIILDRLREMVRLGAGLDEQGRLTREATEAALACLERFGQRLHDMKAESVRVVGTNTLRRAKRKGAFLDRARAALGHPIEIISGIEEARLIYLGVAHTMPSEPGRRLVVDIGGGSTEIIIGEGVHAKKLESLYMGCVSMSSRYFNDGGITEKRMKRARLAARLELEPVRATFRNYGWDQAVGSSGTIRSVGDVIRARNNGDGAITPAAVESLIEQAVRAGDVSKLRLPGLTRGALAGVRGRTGDPGRDPRASRHQAACASRTARCARDCCTTWSAASPTRMRARAACARCRAATTSTRRRRSGSKRQRWTSCAQTTGEWQLDEPFAELVLSWAARLHEIGLDVSHSHYHKHGAYLLEHADMPGFPQDEQRILAAVVGAHRRKVNVRVVAGSDAAVAHQGRVPDRAVAAGGVAASRPQRDRAAEARAACRRDARWRSCFRRAGSTRIR